VIDRNALAGHEISLSEAHPLGPGLDDGCSPAQIVASASQTDKRRTWGLGETGASGMKSSSAFGGRSSPTAKQKLDPAETHVSQTEVPLQKLFLDVCEVPIRLRNRSTDGEGPPWST
jgi:hypothetical protein